MHVPFRLLIQRVISQSDRQRKYVHLSTFIVSKKLISSSSVLLVYESDFTSYRFHLLSIFLSSRNSTGQVISLLFIFPVINPILNTTLPTEMADVEMQDAATSGPAKAKDSSKSMKAGSSEGAAEEKKKFEVKKVSPPVVERSSFLY